MATGKKLAGKAGTGKAGTGKAGTGKAGTGKAGTGKAGTGKPGIGNQETGTKLAGRKEPPAARKGGGRLQPGAGEASLSREGKAALSHRVNALLHTVRTIAQHEDELCTFWHATRAAGRGAAARGALRTKTSGSKGGSKAETALYQELLGILEKLPAREYVDDLEAVREALPGSGR